MQEAAAYTERITGLPEIRRHLRFEQGRREEAQKAQKTAKSQQRAHRTTGSRTQGRRTTRFYGD